MYQITIIFKDNVPKEKIEELYNAAIKLPEVANVSWNEVNTTEKISTFKDLLDKLFGSRASEIK